MKKKLLGDLGNFPEGTMAIGRLDKDSEGLLLLTTDGKTSETVRSNKIEKEYFVQLDGIIDEPSLEALRNGVVITVNKDSYLTKKVCAYRLGDIPKLPERSKKIRDDRHGPTCWISITMREGKFRQIRRMTAVVGYPTLRLVRYRIGSITIDDMQAGDSKELTTKQLEELLPR